MDEINNIIKEKGVKSSGCDYHTLRTLENNGRIRALVIKGENILHIEYTCPFCGKSGYKTQEWEQVSKATKIKFITNCDFCGKSIKIEKLKGKK